MGVALKAKASDVVLRKSNSLVQACYRLEVVELRALLLALHKGLEDDCFSVGDDTCRSSAKPILLLAADFCEHFPGMDAAHVYGQMRAAFRGIMRKPISFIMTTDGAETEREMPWLSQADYKKDEGSIEVLFNERVVPHITRLDKRYTEIRLGAAAKLTSAHAIRLYEMLCQFRSTKTRDISIEWLRTTLMLESEYESVFELKRRVIDPAVKQINALTDLTVSYTQKKKGRVVDSLLFLIREKTSTQPARLAPIDEILINATARPGETRDQTYQRIRVDRSQAQKPTRRRLVQVQIDLTGIEPPLATQRETPAVKSERSNVLRAALKKSV